MSVDNKIEQSLTFKDKLVFSVIFLCFVSFISFNYYLNEVWVLYKILLFCFICGLSFFLATLCPKGCGLISFVKESRVELKKVIWPSKQEASNITLVVIFAVILLGLMLWLLDSVIIIASNFILGVG